jgi:hypothetical protein
VDCVALIATTPTDAAALKAVGYAAHPLLVEAVSARRGCAAVAELPQVLRLSDTMRVHKNVALPLWHLGTARAESQTRARSALTVVSVDWAERRSPDQPHSRFDYEQPTLLRFRARLPDTSEPRSGLACAGCVKHLVQISRRAHSPG